jgi:hypothetical protein
VPSGSRTAPPGNVELCMSTTLVVLAATLSISVPAPVTSST